MSSGDFIRANFSKHFEPSASGFTYRTAPGAAGIPVSIDERRELEADLDRRIRRAGVLANGWLLAGVALVPPALLWHFDAHPLIQMAGLVCVGVLALSPSLRWQRAALKRVAGRTPVDRGLSRRDITLRKAAEQSWFRTVLFSLTPLVYLKTLTLNHDDAPTQVVLITIAVLAACGGIVDLSAKIWLALRRPGSA